VSELVSEVFLKSNLFASLTFIYIYSNIVCLFSVPMTSAKKADVKQSIHRTF
jgi:hypothetical protein